MPLKAIYKKNDQEVIILQFIEGATSEATGPVAIFYNQSDTDKYLCSDLIKYFKIIEENRLNE